MRIVANFYLGVRAMNELEDQVTQPAYNKAVEFEAAEFTEAALREAFEDFISTAKHGLFE